jgi:hypothetical protein
VAVELCPVDVLKTRTARERSPPRRAPTHRPRLRVLPWLVASKTSARSDRSFDTIARRALRYGTRGFLLWHDKPASSATADLATLPPRVSGFISRPLVCRPLFVSRAATLAGNLALLFGGHGRESAPFFTFCSHRCLRLVADTSLSHELRRDPSGPAVLADPERAGDAVRRAASPALRPSRRACRDLGIGRQRAGLPTPQYSPMHPGFIKVCAADAQPALR